ncbi:hypothetical protein CROQUDRAFT_96830 [Cronartium quercuum f. sp. fusiforme G11]|uniref:Uncharacterized protein n=1 Tax=Cronartium quercuum f. sp. fusiforme G11 TaxID=708437 RepID=A0A9P6T8D5_9BASI|nr:hypothetical protein CROQUDRAFT_96830 [Cronartium quercuum f. sp. fusiforme G11]
MKAVTHSHIEAKRHTMLKEATDKVKSRLEKMCHDLEQNLITVFMKDWVGKMERDYVAVLVVEEDEEKLIKGVFDNKPVVTDEPRV